MSTAAPLRAPHPVADGRSLVVRDCTSSGLPGWLRVSARSEPDRARLLAALAEETA